MRWKRAARANAPLAQEATVEGGILSCSRHGSQFDLAHDCAIVRGPAGRPAMVYDVRVEGGDVLVASRAVAAPR